MRYFILIIVIICACTTLCAQYPRRTAEDIARKQTEMLVRELNIRDSIIRDTLYHLHLKYAHKREISNTRAEAMQYMQEINAELQNILTPEQYQQFMNQQVNYGPHRPHKPYNSIINHKTDSTTPHEHDEAHNTPLPLPVSPL
jgi:hypothetical protein